MESVTVRDLRNHGGEVLDRVARGEALLVTRDKAQVAELRPLTRRSPSSAELIALRSAGRNPSARAYHALIAASATAEDLPLYTCNPCDFAGIAELDLRPVPHSDGRA